MRIKLLIIHVLMDMAIVISLVAGYFIGIDVGKDYLFISNKFTQIYAGILGITVILVFISFLKSTVLLFLKSVNLYAVAQPECNSILQATKGILKKFDKTLEVFVLVELVSRSVKELKEIILDYTQATEGENTGPISVLMTESQNTNFAILTKFGKKYLEKSLTYIDECILVHCYSQDDVKMIDAVKQSFTKFLKNFPFIIEKIVAISFLQLLCKLLILVISIALFIRFFSLEFQYIVISYIAYKAFVFIVEDAILEPCMMISVAREFIKNSETDDNKNVTISDEVVQQVIDSSPSLKSLYGLQRLSTSFFPQKHKEEQKDALEGQNFDEDSEVLK